MRRRFSYVVIVVVALLLASQMAVQAQQSPCGVLGCPTPEPTATPVPNSPAPAPSGPVSTTKPGRTPKPHPKQTLPPIAPPTDAPLTPTPKPKAAKATATPGFDGITPNSTLPPSLQSGPVPDIPRTLPNNSTKLVEALQPLTELGLPLQQVLIEGMGRFPIAGLAYWHDDWLEPRLTPVPHLHHGLDLFADFGTPIRAVDNGTVSFLNDPEGFGTGIQEQAQDGTVYIYAHMQSIADDVKPGDHVKLGQVIGYVGNTGNAAGGPPHCHFEVHKPDAVPPKPFVDSWLAQAIKDAPAFVAMRRAQILGLKGGAAVAATTAQNTPAISKKSLDASMVVTALDPVGGSVGILPRLQLEKAKHEQISNELLLQLIKDRIGGYLFAPPATANGHSSD